MERLQRSDNWLLAHWQNIRNLSCLFELFLDASLMSLGYLLSIVMSEQERLLVLMSGVEQNLVLGNFETPTLFMNAAFA